MTAMSIDETTFNAALERHRRELHVHCYRMLGSFDEAEDALQDAFLRAWKARDSFAGGEGLRAWLYKIATNVCLDGLRAKKRRPTANEVPWLQPYPDRLLDEVAPSEEEPDAVVVARETIELTYMTVIQLLPPRQRAVLVLRDVLEWSAIETAEMLELSVPAANSALQRARATLKERLPERSDERVELSEDEQRLLQGFIATPRERRLVDRGRADARGHPRLDAAEPGRLREHRRDPPAVREGGGDGRVAARADEREPDAVRRVLPAPPRRHGVPRLQARRHPQARGRRDRRGDDVRLQAVPRVRAAR